MRFLPALAGAMLVALAGGAHAQTPTLTYCWPGSSPWVPCPPTSGSGSVAPPPLVVTPTDRSGSITTGGTSKQLAAANALRRGLVIQNPCTATEQGIATAENLYVATGGAAATTTNGNYANLAPCGSASLDYNNHVDQTQVNVNAATASHKWNATEYQ